MKEKYVKPKIQFMDLELSQSIASCQLVTNGQTGEEQVITIMDPGWEGVTILTGNCDYTPPTYSFGNSNEYHDDGLCYHVPAETYALFQS